MKYNQKLILSLKYKENSLLRKNKKAGQIKLNKVKQNKNKTVKYFENYM